MLWFSSPVPSLLLCSPCSHRAPETLHLLSGEAMTWTTAVWENRAHFDNYELSRWNRGQWTKVEKKKSVRIRSGTLEFNENIVKELTCREQDRLYNLTRDCGRRTFSEKAQYKESLDITEAIQACRAHLTRAEKERRKTKSINMD